MKVKEKPSEHSIQQLDTRMVMIEISPMDFDEFDYGESQHTKSWRMQLRQTIGYYSGTPVKVEAGDVV